MNESNLIHSERTEARQRIDVARAFKLRMAGLSYEDVGKALGGFTKSSVFQALASFRALIENPGEIATFKEHEGQVLDGVRAKLIRLISERLSEEKNSAYQLTGMYGLLFDKTRLIEGKSTANVANLTAIIEAAAGLGRGQAGPSLAQAEELPLVPAQAGNGLEPDNGRYVNSLPNVANTSPSTQAKPRRAPNGASLEVRAQRHRDAARESARRRKARLALARAMPRQDEGGTAPQGAGGNGETEL